MCWGLKCLYLFSPLKCVHQEYFYWIKFQPFKKHSGGDPFASRLHYHGSHFTWPIKCSEWIIKKWIRVGYRSDRGECILCCGGTKLGHDDCMLIHCERNKRGVLIRLLITDLKKKKKTPPRLVLSHVHDRWCSLSLSRSLSLSHVILTFLFQLFSPVSCWLFVNPFHLLMLLRVCCFVLNCPSLYLCLHWIP